MPPTPDSAQGGVNGGMRVLSAHSGADFESGAVHRRRGVNDEDMTNLRDGEAEGGSVDMDRAAAPGTTDQQAPADSGYIGTYVLYSQEPKSDTRILG